MVARSKQGLWLAIGIVAVLVVFVVWRFRLQDVVPTAGQDAAVLAPEQAIQDVPGIDSFDHAAHHEALVELAPIHHARMADALLAQQALADHEAILLDRPEFQAVMEEIEVLRASREQVVEPGVGPSLDDESGADEPVDELLAAEGLLVEMFGRDATWVERKAEAEAADARRLAARQLIVERIQNRMRHDFAVKRAEREQEGADGEP